MHDFLAYFHIVLSLCILMRREDAIEAASILIFVLVQQLPLSLRILRLYLVGFLEAIQHPLLLLLDLLRRWLRIPRLLLQAIWQIRHSHAIRVLRKCISCSWVHRSNRRDY